MITSFIFLRIDASQFCPDLCWIFKPLETSMHKLVMVILTYKPKWRFTIILEVENPWLDERHLHWNGDDSIQRPLRRDERPPARLSQLNRINWFQSLFSDQILKMILNSGFPFPDVIGNLFKIVHPEPNLNWRHFANLFAILGRLLNG